MSESNAPRLDEGAGMSPDEALALEWALGTLEGRARRAADDRRRTDPGFAALCADWAERLLPLADEAEPLAPSPGLWSRIEAAIDAAGAPPAPDPLQAPARASGWWQSLAFWRGATAAMAALALALLVTRPPPAAEAPAPAPAAARGMLLSATLADARGVPLATAALDTGRNAVVLAPVGEEALGGRVPELWLIPADGRPRSLGLIDLGGAQRIALPEPLLELVAEGAVLAVSLEPAGGSPTGAPTGPVVATGALAPV